VLVGFASIGRYAASGFMPHVNGICPWNVGCERFGAA